MNLQPPNPVGAKALGAPFFEKQAQDGQARAGRLELAHGTVLTPIFMPVGTYGAFQTFRGTTFATPVRLASLIGGLLYEIFRGEPVNPLSVLHCFTCTDRLIEIERLLKLSTRTL